MKQGKKFTRSQKQIVAGNMLRPEEWLYVSETDFNIRVRNRTTGIEKLITKFPRKYKN